MASHITLSQAVQRILSCDDSVSELLHLDDAARVHLVTELQKDLPLEFKKLINSMKKGQEELEALPDPELGYIEFEPNWGVVMTFQLGVAFKAPGMFEAMLPLVFYSQDFLDDLTDWEIGEEAFGTAMAMLCPIGKWRIFFDLCRKAGAHHAWERCGHALLACVALGVVSNEEVAQQIKTELKALFGHRAQDESSPLGLLSVWLALRMGLRDVLDDIHNLLGLYVIHRADVDLKACARLRHGGSPIEQIDYIDGTTRFTVEATIELGAILRASKEMDAHIEAQEEDEEDDEDDPADFLEDPELRAVPMAKLFRTPEKISASQPCPCGSGINAETCCLPKVLTVRTSMKAKLVQDRIHFLEADHVEVSEWVGPEPSARECRILSMVQKLDYRITAKDVMTIESFAQKGGPTSPAWMHVAGGYELLRQVDKTAEVLGKLLEADPRYLFCAANYAWLQMSRGYDDEVPTILRNCVSATEFTPRFYAPPADALERFYSVWCQYHLFEGNLVEAGVYMDMLEMMRCSNLPTIEEAFMGACALHVCDLQEREFKADVERLENSPST